MPRLTTPPALLRQAPRVLAPLPADERARDRQRDAAAPWRAWYRTKRWQALRRDVLRRDGWMCRKTGVLLIGKYPAPNSAVVDHIVPHRGDPKLFWDERNLQALSKVYHDTEKQRQDHAQW